MCVCVCAMCVFAMCVFAMCLVCHVCVGWVLGVCVQWVFVPCVFGVPCVCWVCNVGVGCVCVCNGCVGGHACDKTQLCTGQTSIQSCHYSKGKYLEYTIVKH